MTQLQWMAWTWPTAVFFLGIATLLTIFSWLAIKYPEAEKRGILGIETTRGDRLFVTLVGSAYINLAWLGLVDLSQYYAVIPSLLYAYAVFRWV